jgi:hypothetical protein
MIASGSAGPTWRCGPGSSTRPPRCWTAACAAGPTTWQSGARLDWAVAALDAREVVRCLPQLPVNFAAPGESLELQAWLAAQRGDAAAEHRALERLRDEQPGRIEALERLVELAIRSGQPDRATGLRRQKAERDRAWARYRTWIFQADLTPAVPELARLAERLGRRFEARGWATELLARESIRAEARQLLARLD